MMISLATSTALACGGFFCNNLPDPVVQTAERLLFEVEPTGDVTTWVEIQYEGDPSDFAWLLPVAGPVDPVEGIGTAPPGLFDALELATAPQFVQPASATDIAYGSACSGPCTNLNHLSDGVVFTVPDTSGVEVVGEAVVGPYAIEILTATEGDNLVNWLLLNGYAFPQTAQEPLDHYIALGLQFVAVKLLPDVREGPIDTLVVSCAAGTPTIPLLLTAIASAPSLEITAYVLDDVRYAPENQDVLAFDHGAVERLPDGSTNYDLLLEQAVVDAGGQAWITELAAPIDALPLSEEVAAALSDGTYLTRLHSFVRPEDMTLDPSFAPAPGQPDVSNVHVLGAPTATVSASFGSGAVLLALGVLVRRRGTLRGS
jgi:Uncharacterized protein conserved in bacteria (DUF2330)